MSRATDVVERIQGAFSAADGAAHFAACFRDDAVQHHPFFPTPNKGREAIEAAESGMFRGFSEVRLVAEHVVEGADGWATVEWRCTATNTGPIGMPDGTEIPPTGRAIELLMASVLHIGDDGLITEEHRYQDNLAFLQQLGLA